MKKISIVALIGFVLILILAFLLTQLKGLDFMEQPIISIDTNKTQLHFIHWINFPDVVFKAFEKENPNIIVEYEKLDGADYSNLIRAKLVSHNDIDLFGIKANDYSEFVTSGYLENLTYKDYVEAFEPTVNEGVKNMVFNHVQYAVSYNTCSYGVWYNKSIFERNGLEIPKSYEAFLEICYQLKAVGINPIVMGGRDDKSMRVIYLLSDLFASESTTFKEELKNGTVHWTDESIMDAITKADKFIDKEFIMKESIYLTYQQAFQEFVKGSAAMTIMSSNSMDLGQIDFEQQAGEFGVFSLPSNHASASQVNELEYGNELIGIFLSSEHNVEANLFLEFLTRADIVSQYMDVLKVEVPISDLDYSEIKYADQWAVLENLTSSPVTTHFLDYRLEKKFDSLTKQLMIRSISVQDMAETLNQLQQQINHEDRQ